MQLQTISKALLAATAGSLFALGASPAFAQDTATLAVKGTIVPAACSANFTGGDTVDFGTIKVVDLPANSYKSLGTKNTALEVNCSADKSVYFSVQDMQRASRIADASMRDTLGAPHVDTIFGLGNTTVGTNVVNLGGYAVTVTNPTVDGNNAGNFLYSLDNARNWDPFPNAQGFLQNINSERYLYSVGTKPNLAKGQSFRFPVGITAGLNKGSELQVAQDTALNGQVMFTINYQ